jgi:ATP/maltotriose-dependent transcriptional regulator MalT
VTTQILTIKLLISSQGLNQVSRSWLLDRLQSGSECKLTFIYAPAGYGKTTLEKERFVLALDGYHPIRTQVIHQALKYLLYDLPQRMRLVIATRTDMLIRLAQLRARGELCEIRSEKLRFTMKKPFAFSIKV